MTRCNACPCPADVPCLGPTTHPHFCRWATEPDPGKHRLIVARSRGIDPPPVPITATLTPLSIVIAQNRTVQACPYRDHRCGCDLPACHAGYGDHDDGRKASREHCLACLKTTWSLP